MNYPPSERRLESGLMLRHRSQPALLKPYRRKVQHDMFGRGIGPLEIFLIVVVVLIVFGAGRLPEVGRGIGTAIKEFRGTIGNKNDSETADSEKSEAKDDEKSA